MTECETATAGLVATKVSLGYRDRQICEDLSLAVPPGGFTVIVGPNACGKSTVLKSLARLIKPTSGEIQLDGQPLGSWKPQVFAKRVGLLPQTALAPEGIRVADLVRRGRSPHHSALSRWTAEDAAAVASALDQTGLRESSGRYVHELSGGQRQRAWIAMLLAQQTDILLLDEPTTFLDLTHQYGVLNLADEIRQTSDRTVVAVLHDLNQASRFATHLVVMDAGRIVAAGPPAEILTSELIEDVYRLRCEVTPDSSKQSLVVVPKYGADMMVV